MNEDGRTLRERPERMTGDFSLAAKAADNAGSRPTKNP